MNKLYYSKLAVNNIKKNGKLYFPYILTCIGSVMMFYIICALFQNSQLGDMFGGAQLQLLLGLGCGIIGLFVTIFLFYSNSFLMKRRKKEFGLYNILGMEKRHISRIMLYESLYTSVFSLIAGLGAGILFSKLIFLALLKILHFDVVLGFEAPVQAVVITAILFCVIFLLCLLNNLRQIHLVNPIELLKGGQVGEKEPKAKWISAVIGALCLAGGYAIALIVKEPMSALMLFFVAVVLVIIGTYLLFGAGSIALLKMLRKNKTFYYKTNHFISVSGMMYRMKQNATGLSNICILSTMVLVMVSGTISLYAGMDDVLKARHPKEFMITAVQSTPEARKEMKATISSVLEKNGVQANNSVSYHSLSFSALQQEDHFQVENYEGQATIPALGDLRTMYFVPLEDYNNGVPADQQKTLQTEADALLFYNRSAYNYDTLHIFDSTFRVQVSDETFQLNGFESAEMTSCYFLIVKNMDVVNRMDALQKAVYGEHSSDIKDMYGFDPGLDNEKAAALFSDLQAALKQTPTQDFAESRQNSLNDFYTIYGGLFFLGIFLGVLFIMATVLIIYYKQVSEGYEDKERFRIMQNVGMSHSEVKKSIHSQVITVFFLPLVTAGLHVCFAFSVIAKLLALLQLSNTTLFLFCMLGTFLVFALFYALIYSATAKAYYKIVS